MTGLLRLWSYIVESAVVIVILVTAVGMMIGLIEPKDALKRMGTILVFAVLLQALPPIIPNLWSTLSQWQHFGVITFFGLVGVLVLPRSRHGTKKVKRNNSHR